MANRRSDNTNNILVLTPVFGICLFILLYFLSAFLYPGGSNADKTAKGFSLLNNYWCDLLGDKAKNGKDNFSRPIAIPAMVILSSTLCVFWYQLPKYFNIKDLEKKVIQYSGIISMMTTVFLFTNYHEPVIIVAGLFGLITLVGTFIGLYKSKWYKFFRLGLFCLILCLINSFIYYTGILISYLPIVQKITFFIFLFWICLITIKLYNNNSLKSTNTA